MLCLLFIFGLLTDVILSSKLESKVSAVTNHTLIISSGTSSISKTSSVIASTSIISSSNSGQLSSRSSKSSSSALSTSSSASGISSSTTRQTSSTTSSSTSSISSSSSGISSTSSSDFPLTTPAILTPTIIYVSTYTVSKHSTYDSNVAGGFFIFGGDEGGFLAFPGLFNDITIPVPEGELADIETGPDGKPTATPESTTGEQTTGTTSTPCSIITGYDYWVECISATTSGQSVTCSTISSSPTIGCSPTVTTETTTVGAACGLQIITDDEIAEDGGCIDSIYCDQSFCNGTALGYTTASASRTTTATCQFVFSGCGCIMRNTISSTSTTMSTRVGLSGFPITQSVPPKYATCSPGPYESGIPIKEGLHSLIYNGAEDVELDIMVAGTNTVLYKITPNVATSISLGGEREANPSYRFCFLNPSTSAVVTMTLSMF